MAAVLQDVVADLRRENARLQTELCAMRDRQAATAEILRTIAGTSGNAGQALQQIAETSARLFGAPSVSIQLVKDGEWAEAYRFGDSAQRVRAAIPLSEIRVGGRNMPGAVVGQNRQIHIPDLDHLDASLADFPGLPHARAAGTRTMCGTPLRCDGNAIGVLIVYRDRLQPFTEGELAIQQSFADQAVIAIENGRLYEEVKARSRELSETLTYQTGSSNILAVIASSPTDVAPVLEAIVENACELCEADDAVVVLKEGDELVFKKQHGSIPIVWTRQPISRDLAAGRALIDRKPIHIHDLLSTEGEQFPDSRGFALRTGVRTVLSVPLLREHEGIGSIVLRRTERKPFGDRQISLLQTFADQAVIAIGNVRLFDEVRARTKELSQSLDHLRTAQDRLVQTEKLASLGQLTAGIAHEIKNPLNFVNNFSALSAELTDELNDVLRRAAFNDISREDIYELTGLLKDNLQKIVHHGKRADSIVKNMLLHSREGSGELRPADINAILDESLNLAYHGARAEKPQFNVTLHRDFDANAGTIEVFPQEMTRVFLNLISNGFYAVTKRKMESSDAGFEPVLNAATRNLGYAVEIRIRDNGTGIPTDVREKMFNPFFTTKPAGEGTGLGLSMSHDIVVKQHGGTIDVQTEAGVFTEFRIVLPRAKNQDKNR